MCSNAWRGGSSGTSSSSARRCNIEVRPSGTVVLQGSVLNEAVKHRAVDIVENTIGVTSVVNELAVVKEVKVIKAKPAGRAIELTPSTTTETESTVKP